MNEKIGLIQVDGTMPNLALMKLSKFFQLKGRDVTIIDLSTLGIDKWLASKIFVGGSGVSLKDSLPKEIETLTPDYEGFKTNYSIGFTSRGCMRNCDFCIVKEKEGELRDVDMSWVKHANVILLDNNFLATPKWRVKLEHFIKNNIKVNFNQGLDIRLVDEEKADMLLKTKSYDRKFKTRAYYFSFDDPKMSSVVKEKVELMTGIGFNPKWIMFYILTGFNTTHQEDKERVELIKELKCVPYTMKYNDRSDDKWINHFDRWVNRKFHEFIPYEEYKNGVLNISEI